MTNSGFYFPAELDHYHILAASLCLQAYPSPSAHPSSLSYPQGPVPLQYTAP